MSQRYSLEKYKTKATRYVCPGCNQAGQFARYIDEATGEALAPHVGKCNRVDNCGYHYPPRQYFDDNPGRRQEHPEGPDRRPARPGVYIPKPPPAPFVLPEMYVLESMTAGQNNFVTFLQGLFGAQAAEELRRKFNIGTNNDFWPGATVFWYMDAQGRPVSGKIMLYDPKTGKRVKNGQNWIHKALEKRYRDSPPEWLKTYSEEAPKMPVPFGLSTASGEDAEKPVCIVESEKTAIIASYTNPEAIWLATGSKGTLSGQRLRAIRDRYIYLFPDAGCFEAWNEAADKMQDDGYKILCTDGIEQWTTPEQKGLDIADLLIEEYRNNPPPQREATTGMREPNHGTREATPGMSRPGPDEANPEPARAGEGPNEASRKPTGANTGPNGGSPARPSLPANWYYDARGYLRDELGLEVATSYQQTDIEAAEPAIRAAVLGELERLGISLRRAKKAV